MEGDRFNDLRGWKDRRRLILLVGPTGVGKSCLALDLARAFDGQIISADSMQVYRYMDIGTDKPDLQSRREVVHHMIDVVDPDEEFNAALFRRLAVPIMEDLFGQGKQVVVAGGTGLYIKVLLGGLMEGTGPHPDRRRRYAERAKQEGKESLHSRLRELDPEAAARIHPNDLFRIVRALEVVEATGEPLSVHHRRHGFGQVRFEVLKIGLVLDRESLYRRIEARVDRMIGQGLIEEVRSLFQRGYGLQHRSMNGLGYRHMARFLLKEWSFEEALERMKRDTRRYAKRQLTWFRRDREIHWHSPDEGERIRERVCRFLES